MTDVLSKCSTENLMARLDAIREGRYHMPSHKNSIMAILALKTPKGSILIWREEKYGNNSDGIHGRNR